MSAFDLNGKRILVTGASNGIGTAVATAISKQGGQLILTGRNKKTLQETLDKLNGDSHSIYPADLTNTESLQYLVGQCPSLDGIVNTAGMVHKSPIKYLSHDDLEDVMKINFYAPAMLTKALVKHKKLNANASLVYITSIAVSMPFAGGTAYSASKAAVANFVKTCALELAGKGIRANAIAPGLIRSEAMDELKATLTDEQLTVLKEQYPLGLGEPADVANTCIYLLSDAARWITGQEIILDGGHSITR